MVQVVTLVHKKALVDLASSLPIKGLKETPNTIQSVAMKSLLVSV